MKYLVSVICLVAAANAVPITPSYGTPLAPVTVVETVPVAPIVPVETVNLPVAGAPIVEPTFLRSFQQSLTPLPPRPAVVPRAFPFAPAASPVVLQRTIATGPVPTPVAPLARALPQVPLPLPAPVAPIAPVVRALPQVPVPTPIAPLARALPQVPVPAAVPSSQFQAQDELGGFSFGYQNANSAKEEVRSADGITRGAYSYIDANGIPQRVEYIADPVNGFRVVGTNIPVAASSAIADTPEVALAKAEFQKAFNAAVARNAEIAIADEPVTATLELRKKRSTTAGYGVPLAPVVPVPTLNRVVVSQALPVSVNPLPLAAGPIVTPNALPLAAGPVVTPNALPLAAGPVVALPKAVISPSSQFHAQDELGGVSFGYQNENSARQEVRNADGTTQGSYSYVDANGITQTVNYIADALGFRVTGTNLPVAVAA